jgi:myo-inositol 2-dehydrogenase/D-chiro-inositol 1-dehydrogenase
MRTGPATRAIRYCHSFLERYADAYRLELDAFVTAVLDGTPLAPDGEDGLRAQLLADAATEAAKSGRPVRLEA